LPSEVLQTFRHQSTFLLRGERRGLLELYTEGLGSVLGLDTIMSWIWDRRCGFDSFAVSGASLLPSPTRDASAFPISLARVASAEFLAFLVFAGPGIFGATGFTL
jgi:hypothetical protein